MGRYSVNLVGESYCQPAIARLTVGDPIELRHTPDNPYDDRAVAALDVAGEKIGHLERDGWLTRLIVDEGKPVQARIQMITGGERGKPSLGVVIEVLTGADAALGFAPNEMGTMSRTPTPTAATPRHVSQPANNRALKVPGWLTVIAVIVLLILVGQLIDRPSDDTLIQSAERARKAQGG